MSPREAPPWWHLGCCLSCPRDPQAASQLVPGWALVSSPAAAGTGWEGLRDSEEPEAAIKDTWWVGRVSGSLELPFQLQCQSWMTRAALLGVGTGALGVGCKHSGPGWLVW